MGITSPTFAPKFVAGYLGIDGSRLPRETYNTIREPSKPPVRRGGKGWYSVLDVILMRLGGMLLEQGLLRKRTQECIDTVRDWIRSVMEDPLIGTPEFDNEKKWRWLIGNQTEDGFAVILGDKEDLLEATISKASGRPHTIINLHHFVTIEMELLGKYEQEHPIN